MMVRIKTLLPALMAALLALPPAPSAAEPAKAASAAAPDKPFGRLNRPRPVLAVLPFHDINARSRELGLGNAFSAMLVTELRNHSNFLVLEPSKIAEVLGFQEMSALGVTQKQIRQLEGAYQAEVALVGDVSTWDGTVEIDGRLISSRSGEVVAAVSGRVSGDKDLRGLAKTLSSALEKKYLRQWMGSVTVACQPVEAEVFLNGEYVGKANAKAALKVDDLLEGRYRLELTAAGYRGWADTVDVAPKSHLTVNASLSALPGNLVMSSQPVGAEVILDGKGVGKTPLEIKNIEEGEHRLKLELPNYYAYEQKVFINSGQSTQLNAQLKIRLGFMDIASQPHGASVNLNGRFYGKSPVRVDKVEPGRMEVEITAPGYRPFKEVFSVKPNDTILIREDLRLQTGRLTVVSRPRDVRVKLVHAEGTLDLGHTPVVRDSLNVGRYALLLEKENYHGKEIPIEITVDEETRVEEGLSPKPGRLALSSDPHTEILVDGAFMGYTPAAVMELPEGEYEVSLNSFHGASQAKVKVESNRETALHKGFAKSRTYLIGSLLFIAALGGLIAL